ncbi:unnamed protein product [Arctogadus glacialis]
MVTLAARPALDAWYGARDWALGGPPSGGGGPVEGWVSRQDYEEKGGHYLSEHRASNASVSMRIAKPAPSVPRPAEPGVATATGDTPTPAAAVAPGGPAVPAASVPASVEAEAQMVTS